ncbi:sensor histidine kinase [Fulvivirga sedimenti]|uniref:Histidine kinase n=1 Tax=Fulvivirga sedimenti TaxID=2879465 RepID=A0A9X1HXM0_9BACT|nr:histidine kinase [Fulvivirga sedimenti]MCA6078337.1 histidine kinase [Fulvivirga sedimenti]
MNKARLYWSLQIGAWLIFAVLQMIGFVEFQQKELTSTQVYFYLSEAAAFMLITHFFRYVLIKSGWLSLYFRELIPRVVFSVIVMAMVMYGIRLLISLPLDIFVASAAFDSGKLISLVTGYTIILFLWAVFYLTYHYFERYNLSLKRQAEMNEIELSNLKSQLNPHFIFNALNSIRALVDEDPKKSKHAITQLSTILRSTLVSDQNSLANFEDELKTVRNYLGLESIRYEERLKVDYEIDPESYKFQVPPLMLQTLVENGIKHGISQLKEGGVIKISSKVKGDHLQLIIRNSGQLRKMNGRAHKKPGGLGLINTRRRLDLIYGKNASFQIKNESGTMVRTELVLPYNRMEYESADN